MASLYFPLVSPRQWSLAGDLGRYTSVSLSGICVKISGAKFRKDRLRSMRYGWLIARAKI
jgi:hypothetical protein